MNEKIIVYGERPITQFILSLSNREQVQNIINKIEYLKSAPTPVPDISKLKTIFIEAPLRKGTGPDRTGTPDIVFEFENINLICEVKPASFEKTTNTRDDYADQIRRYHNFIKNPYYEGDKELVVRLTEIIKGNDNYLILITDDDIAPKNDLLGIMAEHSFDKLGWLPYSTFREIANNYGFDIRGEHPHIWIEKSFS